MTMLCPHCREKTRVIDTVTNEVDGEIYRLRQCIECGRKFYTIESECFDGQKFAENWEKYHRKYYNRKIRRKDQC